MLLPRRGRIARGPPIVVRLAFDESRLQIYSDSRSDLSIFGDPWSLRSGRGLLLSVRFSIRR